MVEAPGKTDKRDAAATNRPIGFSRDFRLHEGLSITLDGSKEIELNGIKVRMAPLYRWLLS